MLNINLLPPEEQKSITIEKWFRVIRFLGIMLSAVLIIGTTLLAPSFLPLYFENRELMHLLVLQQETIKKINAADTLEDATRVQSTIKSLRQSINRPAMSLVIFDLITAPQHGIIITSFAIDNARSISLVGNAISRDDLLKFEQHLRDSAHFQNLASPLANIIQEKNINFNFKASLKPELAL